MGDKNLPAVNPMNEIMMNGMPNLPQIIAGAMPKFIPPASFEQNPISLWFGNKKVGQLEKRASMEASIAYNTKQAMQDKLEGMHAVITFSERIADTIGLYQHKKEMRKLLERNWELLNNRQELENNNLTIMGYKLQAEASVIGWEAKLSELEYKMKEKQMQEIMEGK